MTGWPASGEVRAAPWMPRIRVPPVPPPEVELRGVGAVTAKSAALLSVSVAPPPARTAAVVLARFPVGEPSAEEAVVP